MQAGAVVGADSGQVVLRQALDRVSGRDPAERLRVFVEGEHGHDRQARDTLDGLDRGGQLVQVEEGLDHEEVDTAAVEERRLLAEDGPTLGLVEATELAERADGAGDVDVAARDLPRLPCQLHARLVDRGDLVLEEAGAQLVPVGTKCVGLDQLRAGGDEARVQGDDALWRSDVRLLGAAQTGHRARDQHAHAAVGNDGRPLFKPF